VTLDGLALAESTSLALQLHVLVWRREAVLHVTLERPSVGVVDEQNSWTPPALRPGRRGITERRIAFKEARAGAGIDRGLSVFLLASSGTRREGWEP
jgi:hypothetical protein